MDKLRRRDKLRTELSIVKAKMKYIEDELAEVNQSIRVKEWSKKEGKFFDLSERKTYKEFYYLHKVSDKGNAICDIYLNYRLDRKGVEIHVNRLKTLCDEDELLTLQWHIDKEHSLQTEWIGKQFIG